jgi:nucleotide-binding universal stress UspA family protein
MRTLLAVDGSDQSYEAMRALGHLSPTKDLIVLHALDVPRWAYPIIAPQTMQDLSATIEQGMREDGERLLNRVISILPLHTGPVSKRLETGAPADVILSTAEKERTDLIVMGARGVNPVRELVFGSVSHRVLTHAPCATLVVNAPMRWLRRMLLPLQGPEDAESAVRLLAAKPFREPPEVTVLTAVPLAQPPAGDPLTESIREEMLGNARRFVEGVVAQLSALQYQAKGLAVPDMPVTAIFQEASTSKPDLILMGSRGRRGITRFLLGGVSHAVLHRAACPVLVFR